MINEINTYQAGDTVQLKCTFKDFDGVNVDPYIVKITFYNYRFSKLSEAILTSENKVDIGVYVFNYVTPMDSEQRIIYEWYGEIEGTPSLKRASFRTVFI